MKTFETRAADGTRLLGTRWTPSAHRADILLVHGLGEHIGRYDHVATALADAGYRVTGVDLRGHGRSEGRRGHVTAWSDYLDDVAAAAREIDGPFAMFGHSMGALITLDYLREHPAWAAYTSAIPIDFSVAVPGWKLAASGVLSRWIPWLGMSNELDPNGIAADRAVVERYKADPLVHDRVTPRWFTEFVAAGKRVDAHAARYRTPLLVAWGDDDPIPSIPAMQAFAGRYGGDHEVRHYPGLKHEIHNEPSWREIIGEIARYFERFEPAHARPQPEASA